MPLTLPLDKMTIEEKLSVLDEVWAGLARTPEQVASPPWHQDVLEERERRIREGTAEFLPIEAARKRLDERLP